jgi:hypothetical protein
MKVLIQSALVTLIIFVSNIFINTKKNFISILLSFFSLQVLGILFLKFLLLNMTFLKFKIQYHLTNLCMTPNKK